MADEAASETTTGYSADHRLSASKDVLAKKLAAFCRGRELTRQTVHDVQQIYKDHRANARLMGVEFPELVVLVMDVQKRVVLVRRDLDKLGIDNLVVELARSQGGTYDPGEVARAVRRAFPHYRPAAEPRDLS